MPLSLLRITFLRSRKGLNLVGMLSQVFLPMTTVFRLAEGAREVTRAKKAISLGKRHGSFADVPCTTPIPLDIVAATMTVAQDMNETRYLAVCTTPLTAYL